MQGKVSIGVVKREDKVLVVKRSAQESSSGKWCFPGGKIEPGETPDEAALREVVEETSLNVEIEDSADSFIAEGELGEWDVYPFLMSEGGGDVRLNHENCEFRWLGKEELEELDALGDMQAAELLDI